MTPCHPVEDPLRPLHIGKCHRKRARTSAGTFGSTVRPKVLSETPPQILGILHPFVVLVADTAALGVYLRRVCADDARDCVPRLPRQGPRPRHLLPRDGGGRAAADGGGPSPRDDKVILLPSCKFTLVIIHTKYTGARQNVFNVYA